MYGIELTESNQMLYIQGSWYACYWLTLTSMCCALCSQHHRWCVNYCNIGLIDRTRSMTYATRGAGSCRRHAACRYTSATPPSITRYLCSTFGQYHQVLTQHCWPVSTGIDAVTLVSITGNGNSICTTVANIVKLFIDCLSRTPVLGLSVL